MSPVVVTLAAAAAPATIGYDGYVTDALGSGQTGSQTVRIRIYDQSSAGTLLLDESHIGIDFSDGYFSLAIGSGSRNGGTVMELADLGFDRQYFLTLEITTLSTGEMLPRIPFNAVAYAYAAYGLIAQAADPVSNLNPGQAYFNTSANVLKFYDGSAWVAVSGDSGLTSLNGQTGSSQIFTLTSSGSDVSISSGDDEHTFNFPSASPTARGLLTSADWVTFNAKQAALGFTPLNPANNLSDIVSPLTARTNLGLGSLATLAGINNGNWSGTALAVGNGGTGQTNANAALNALLSAQSSNSGKFLQTDGTNTAWISGNAGTVTSVGLSLPAIFSVSGSPIIDAGTFSVSLANQNQNLVFGSPDGSAGAPSFRSLVIADLPGSIPNAKLANSSVSLASGTSGTDIGWQAASVSLGGTMTLNIPTASASNRGALSASDWSAFNAKQSALGFVPLDPANNLSDVAGVSTARNNLGLGSLATLSSINNSNWSGTALAVGNGGTGVTASTGSGAVVLSVSPTLVTPALGAATATSINKLTITAPAAGSTLTIDDGFTLHVTGNVSAFSGTSTGINSGDQTAISGNAGTATALQTGRTINGVSFDGTANITVPAAAGTVSGTTLASNVLSSSLTSVGTLGSLALSGTVTGAASYNGLVIIANTGAITTGIWNGTTIAVTSGGTGTTNGSITGTAALSFISNTSNALTLDSGTTGAVNIGTGANSKAITVGSSTGGTTLALTGGTSWSVSSGGAAIFSGLVTASDGLTLTTGALNLTATSGALALSGLSASSISTGANNLTFTSSNFNSTATGINATAIGVTTPAAGAFTTLSSTGTSNIGQGSGVVTINSSGALNLTGASASTWTLANVANSLNFDANTLSLDALNNRVGIGTTSPGSSLDVNGNITLRGVLNCSGSLQALGTDTAGLMSCHNIVFVSDERLKTDVTPLNPSMGLKLISELNPVAYNWKQPDIYGGTTDRQYGFIAQEAFAVEPTLVGTTTPTALTPDQTYFFNYIGLIPVIVKAIQEQQVLLNGKNGELLSGLSASTVLTDIQNEAPGNALDRISSRIASGAQVITDFIAARVTAVRGYFDEVFAATIHTAQICVQKSDGTEFCATGDDLQAIVSDDPGLAAGVPATVDASPEPAVETEAAGTTTAPAAVTEDVQ